MFDTTRKNLRGQILVAELGITEWIGEAIYIAIPWNEAKELLIIMERLDAGAVVVSPEPVDPRSGFALSALGLDG